MLEAMILASAAGSSGGTISSEQWIIIAIAVLGGYLLGWLTLHIISVRRRNKRRGSKQKTNK